MTQTAYDRFGARVTDLDRDVRCMRMQPDGSLLVGERTVAWDDATPEVAWATADLFDDGAPLRPFFGFLVASSSVRWLQSPAAGVDAPIFATLLSRGMRLTNSHSSAVAIAEYVVGSVLEVFQDRAAWHANQRTRTWAGRDFREVQGSTWLIVGLGHIGSATAARAMAMGASVVGVRRHPSGTEPVDEMLTPSTMARALPRADVVVLSAPATPATERLVNPEFLAAMKPRSVLINIARGSLIDEPALLAALDAGTPAAAVLDVFSTEPLPADHRLWSHPRVTVTPHNAAGGTGRYARAADEFLANLAAYSGDGRLINEVTVADLG